MCTTDEQGTKVSDCGKCICSKSTIYNQHNKVATGETAKIGNVYVSTYKCTRGCGSYQY